MASRRERLGKCRVSVQAKWSETSAAPRHLGREPGKSVSIRPPQPHSLTRLSFPLILQLWSSVRVSAPLGGRTMVYSSLQLPVSQTELCTKMSEKMGLKKIIIILRYLFIYLAASGVNCHT